MRGSVEFGISGPLDVHEFEDLVMRNLWKPNVRFIQSRWGRHNGAPVDTFTLVKNNPDHGDAYNVPYPQIPERTIIDHETGRVKARGWRQLLINLVADATVCPSQQIRRAMGYHDFEKAKRTLGCV